MNAAGALFMYNEVHNNTAHSAQLPLSGTHSHLAFATTHTFNRLLKGAITSKIKHAIKHKTSPARLAQLLQPLLAFCFSLQLAASDGIPSRTVRYAVIGCKSKCKLQAKTKC